MDFLEIYKLPKPEMRENHKIGFNVGIRPKRKNGIRIETEKFEDKLIVHNYGHGGGGVSLMFGACIQSIEKFRKSLNKNPKFKKEKRATVIGAGYFSI